MSLDIRGASGNLLEITQRGEAKVLAVTLGGQAQNALKDDRTWTITTTVTPTGANDYFMYLLNNSQTRRIVITRLAGNFTAAETVQLQGVTGTAVGGTTLAPLNRTITSPKIPTSATIQSGVDITGLTSSGTRELIRVTAAGFTEKFFNDRPVVVPQNAAVALLATTGTTAIQFFVDIYEDLTDPQLVVA